MLALLAAGALQSTKLPFHVPYGYVKRQHEVGFPDYFWSRSWRRGDDELILTIRKGGQVSLQTTVAGAVSSRAITVCGHSGREIFGVQQGLRFHAVMIETGGTSYFLSHAYVYGRNPDKAAEDSLKTLCPVK